MTEAEAIKHLKDILEEATSYENAVCYVTDCDKEPLEMAIKALEKQIDGGWIPCSERLPKNHERILCMHSSGFIDCGDFICESWCCDMDEYSIKKDEVIAWQPLPAPYQKGE